MKSLIVFLLIVSFVSLAWGQDLQQKKLSDECITEIIEKHRPLKGYRVPADIEHRLGATHVGGKYYFTDEPYIIEGARKLSEMGYGVIKLWLTKNERQYPYNSDWDLSKDVTLKELAQHPYYQTCFDMPFSTIALSVGGAGLRTTPESVAREEKQIYELTKYLLKKYKDREVNFILHNWEGDWLLRGGTGSHARWSRNPGQPIDAVDGQRHTVAVPADSMLRVNAMSKWFEARQKGVSRARAENPNSKCKVYHAIEANKVLDSMKGIPGIASYVLPNVEVDMVSWSSYDGMDPDGTDLFRGIEYLRNQMKPTPYMNGDRVVFLGEIGIPEQRYEGLTEKDAVIERWDTYIGVCLALDVPYIIQWELYCNEPKNEKFRRVLETRKTDEMRGFWLIRPDGTQSFVGQYFEKLLKNSGEKIE
ncbi:hypothetical protein [Marinilabilia rubra]|uniref:Glycoside hydrolase family 42 N-terminal domain-containing protein n=1 Tax=Marinilabilia rubra TaxID=2162893 RepID=A0A2U2B7A6_9BACT|nr:hypothetical protein [Marinilabilia rubra]PWD98960.1 hypothetical protein DDZ16_13265 [Marinilabilia rubra]